MVVRLDKNTLTAIAKAKQPPCQQILLESAIDLQMCFLALAIASKKNPKPSVKLAQSGRDLVQSVKLGV